MVTPVPVTDAKKLPQRRASVVTMIPQGSRWEECECGATELCYEHRGQGALLPNWWKHNFRGELAESLPPRGVKISSPQPTRFWFMQAVFPEGHHWAESLRPLRKSGKVHKRSLVHTPPENNERSMQGSTGTFHRHVASQQFPSKMPHAFSGF